MNFTFTDFVNNVSTNNLLEFMFHLFLVAGVSYLIYREKDIALWERKVWKKAKRYMKAFVKACYYTYFDKKNAQKDIS